MAELTRTLDDVVRRERGRVVGGLVRLLGSIDAAEEAFQDAVLAALAGWPRDGMPDNPAAWLTSTARNHARDAERHRRVVAKKAPLLVEDAFIAPETIASVHDDELRLIFTCCHPALTRESQVALTLKVVAGFTTDEIARAFLSPEPTVAQRVVRAKRTIEDKKLPYEVPDRRALPERLASVLAVIYLVFNEGFAAHEGPLVRVDLQREALRLSHALCDLLPNEPEAFGLFALIAFSFARIATRTDADGELLLLSQQDRACWDRPMIKEALMALGRARRLAGGASYLRQAEIASCHVTAETWEATDWRVIVRHYEALRSLDDSPVVALNHAVAVSMRDGAAAGLVALDGLAQPLAGYHLFHAMRADFRRQLGQDARPDYRSAIELATNESERRFLQRRLDAIDGEKID